MNAILLFISLFKVDRLQHELKHIEKRHHNEKEAIVSISYSCLLGFKSFILWWIEDERAEHEVERLPGQTETKDKRSRDFAKRIDSVERVSQKESSNAKRARRRKAIFEVSSLFLFHRIIKSNTHRLNRFQIKEAMVMNEREHKEQMIRIEEKFFEEKMRLQIEANKKIEELAEKAHDAAVK